MIPVGCPLAAGSVHPASHLMSMGEILAVLYAMTAIAAEPVVDLGRRDGSLTSMLCPLQALELARDCESYLEHVRQMEALSTFATEQRAPVPEYRKAP